MTSATFSESELVSKLHDLLPELATTLIQQHLDMADPRNQSFAARPDDPAEHSPRWHQYGIVTHSYEFARAMREDIPHYCKEWGLQQPVDAALDSEIDGLSRRQLLQIVSILHDTGKFAVRYWELNSETNTTLARFETHEVSSGRVIRTELKPVLLNYGLTENQIGYIATCAELHFELAKVRKASKEMPGGYSLGFVASPAFDAAARAILNAHPDYALEIGLLFIADGLSKTEVAAEGASDEAIAAQRPALEAEITAKGLNPMLINQALQKPVNLAVAKAYLQIWANQ